MRASIIGLTVLVAAASPAAADNTKAKAKALYESGLKHYNLAEYPEAIKDWKEAYSLSKKTLLLFNIAQAYRLSGDCKLAGTFYDTYQREEPNPKNQDELDQALSLCAKAADKPADKPLDKPKDKPVDKPKDKPKDKPVTPVAPIADATPTKRPDVAQAGTGEGSGGEGDVELEATTGGGLRKVGFGVAGLGVALGVVGVVFAVKSGSKSDMLDGFDMEWGPTQQAIEDDGKAAAKKAWIFGIAGAASIAAGAVLIAIGGPKQVDSSSVTVVPTHGGAAFGYGFKF